MFIFAASPIEVNSIPAIRFGLPASHFEADDFRPTAGPDFTPTAEDEAEAAQMFNGDDEPTDAEWDAMADDAAALDMACSGFAWL